VISAHVLPPRPLVLLDLQVSCWRARTFVKYERRQGQEAYTRVSCQRVSRFFVSVCLTSHAEPLSSFPVVHLLCRMAGVPLLCIPSPPMISSHIRTRQKLASWTSRRKFRHYSLMTRRTLLHNGCMVICYCGKEV